MAVSQPQQSAPNVLWVNLSHSVTCEVAGLLVPFNGTMTRLSEQGAWLAAEIEIQVGRQMKLDWRPRTDKPMTLQGQIVTMKQEQPESLLRLYGVRFINLTKNNLDVLIREIMEIDRRNKAKERPQQESSVSRQVAAQLGTKRAAFRAPVAFPAKYAKVGQIAKRMGQASNVSTGGIGFETIETFEVGTVLDFQLDLPGDVLERAKLAPSGDRTVHGIPVRPFERLNVKGKVVKAVRPKPTSPWQYGIAFLDPDPLVVEELRRYIHLSQLDHLASRIQDS